MSEPTAGKFKIGDRIKVTKVGTFTKGSGVEIGYTGTVTHVIGTPSEWDDILWLDETYAVRSSDVELSK